MLAKVRPLYVLIAGPLPLVIISAVCYFVLIRPQYNPDKPGSLAQLTEEATQYENRAAELPTWESRHAQAQQRLLTTQQQYIQVAKTKGLPLNPNQEAEYTIRLWFLHLEDFRNLTQQVLSKAPCEVSPRQLNLGGPPMPPPPKPGPDGFLALGSHTLTATGSLEQIWQCMRYLSHFDKCVVRLDSLGLAGAADGTVVATLPIQMWMLVEQAGPSAGAAATGRVVAVAGGGGGEEGEEEEEGQEEEEEEEESSEEE
jgi:hypothetical protein